MTNHTGNITSLITAILLPFLAIIGVEATLQDNIIALIAGIIALILWYLDVRYKSDLFKEQNQ
jgi:Flp pilus assembly protein TadB